jgi:hypothetical protein
MQILLGEDAALKLADDQATEAVTQLILTTLGVPEAGPLAIAAEKVIGQLVDAAFDKADKAIKQKENDPASGLQDTVIAASFIPQANNELDTLTALFQALPDLLTRTVLLLGAKVLKDKLNALNSFLLRLNQAT